MSTDRHRRPLHRPDILAETRDGFSINRPTGTCHCIMSAHGAEQPEKRSETLEKASTDCGARTFNTVSKQYGQMAEGIELTDVTVWTANSFSDRKAFLDSVRHHRE